MCGAFDQLLSDGQAETGAAVGALGGRGGLYEGAEDGLLLLLRDAAPVVDDLVGDCERRVTPRITPFLLQLTLVGGDTDTQ